MYHFKARVYSPSLGRFLQTDPAGYRDGLNLYAYAGNDPINRIDPTGMAYCKWGGGGATCFPSLPTPGVFGAEYLSSATYGSNLPPAPYGSGAGYGGGGAPQPEDAGELRPLELPERAGSCLTGAKGPSTQFWNEDEAQADLLLFASIDQRNKGDNFERGGDTFPHPMGGYTYNDIQTGDSDSVNVRIRRGATAWGHLHPAVPGNPALNRDNRRPSGGDYDQGEYAANQLGISNLKLYIGGPDGAVRRFNLKQRGTGFQVRRPGYLSCE